MARLFEQAWSLARTQALYLLILQGLTGVTADVPFHEDLVSFQDGIIGNQPRQIFYSAPGIKAPIYQVNRLEPDLADPAPYIFLTGAYSGHGYGPSIISSKDLSLIWADENYSKAQTLQPFTFKGQPVLSVFEAGYIAIYNQHYEQLYKIRPQGPSGTQDDDHECFLTHNDTGIQIIARSIPYDLRPIGGPETGEDLRNGYFQEVDPVTNRLVFEFSTLDHFPLNTSYWPYKGQGVYNLGMAAHDYCHMNSVEKTLDGDYLVSYRHFSAVVLIDGKTSKVKWIMGGKLNQFEDVTVNGSATFEWQHQARFTGPNTLILFDNAQLKNGFCPDGDDHCSRGVEIEFDTDAMTMKVIGEWYHPQSIITASRGGVQRLPNGGTFVAWGQNAMYTEHSPDGEVVLDFQRSLIEESDHGTRSVIAYRAWKGDWEGKPHWGPNISADGEENDRTIHVSWNGATNVAKWALLLSSSTLDLDGSHNVVDQQPRMGFETGFRVPSDNESAFARVAALNDRGEIIGSTPAVDIKSGELHTLDYPVSSVPDTGEFHETSFPKGPAVILPSSPDILTEDDAFLLQPLLLLSGVFLGFSIAIIYGIRRSPSLHRVVHASFSFVFGEGKFDVKAEKICV